MLLSIYFIDKTVEENQHVDKFHNRTHLQVSIVSDKKGQNSPIMKWKVA